MICQIEGKKKQLNIAQVKEVLKVIIDNRDINLSLLAILHHNEIKKQILRIKEFKKHLENEHANSKQKALAKNKTKRKK